MAGSQLAYVAVPSGVGTPVLILHSWWGLTRSFTEYADRLAAQGFVAGCVDLYGGRLARNAEEASLLRAAPRRVPMYRSLLSGIDELIAHRAASANRVGIVGFSMGGHWAVWLAQRSDARAGAIVLHYATRMVTKASTPIPVLAHFAESDPLCHSSGEAQDGAVVRALRVALCRHGPPWHHALVRRMHRRRIRPRCRRLSIHSILSTPRRCDSRVNAPPGVASIGTGCYATWNSRR
jgi:dienelactone hydrolase